jgi:hypothetical protein
MQRLRQALWAIRRVDALRDDALVVALHDCVEQRAAVRFDVLDDLNAWALPEEVVPRSRTVFRDF